MSDVEGRREVSMRTARVREILERIGRLSVAVCGDFCLDAYWFLDPRGGEVSAETGLRADAVSRHSYSPGGAANVVANMAALRPRSIRAIGVVGDDIHGRELLRQLHGLGADTAGLIVQADRFDTVTYGKRHAGETEGPRIDFGFFNERRPETDRAVLSHLRDAIRRCEAVVFNQQVPGGLNEAFVAGLNALFDEHPGAIVVCDSRHYGDRFRHVYRKTNDIALLNSSGAAVHAARGAPVPDLERVAVRLYADSGRPVFVTLGSRGILTVAETGVHVAPGIPLRGPIDAVGAGDTVTSALALCLGAGASPAEAAGFANLAAAVTVRRRFQTGTASPEDVLAASEVGRD